MLTKEQILQADDIVTETVSVPEWGGEIMVRALSGAQIDRLEQEITNARVNGVTENVRARWVARCVIDEKGDRLFDDTEIVHLGKKSGAVLDDIFDVCMRINGRGEKYIRELEKNLGRAPTNSSSTD